MGDPGNVAVRAVHFAARFASASKTGAACTCNVQRREVRPGNLTSNKHVQGVDGLGGQGMLPSLGRVGRVHELAASRAGQAGQLPAHGRVVAVGVRPELKGSQLVQLQCVVGWVREVTLISGVRVQVQLCPPCEVVCAKVGLRCAQGSPRPGPSHGERLAGPPPPA